MEITLVTAPACGFMGIRFLCPNGHKLHVKAFLAGKRGVCPKCGAKILIPFDESPGRQEPTQAPAAYQGGPVALAGPLTDISGSASVVIAIADAPVLNTPSAVVPTPVPSPQPAVGQPLNPPETIVPATPAMRYIARRERNRRNQFVFAVVLLVAVLVLAAVLVFVLQRGAGSATVQKSPARSSDDLRSSRHALVVSDRCFNAHRALAVLS